MLKLPKILFASFTIITLAAATNSKMACANNKPLSQQPGDAIHAKIKQNKVYGQTFPVSINRAINTVITDSDHTLPQQAKNLVASDVVLAKQFFNVMLQQSSVIETVKILIESYPDKTTHIIALGVALFPQSTNEVIDGAALSSTMSLEDILILAVQSGANFSDIPMSAISNSSTKLGETALPLGVGIGAGGSGSDDILIKNN